MLILSHLAAYNECGSACVLVAAFIAMLNALLTGESKVGKFCRVEIFPQRDVATATFFSSFTHRKSNLTNKRQQQQQKYSRRIAESLFFAFFSSALIHDRRH